MNEYKIQCEIATYLDALGCLWTASAGGVRTSIGAAVKLKRSGYKKGCPDIMIFEPRKGYSGLFIELKTEDGHPSEAQLDFINGLMQRNYYATVCYGLKDAISAIDFYFKRIT